MAIAGAYAVLLADAIITRLLAYVFPRGTPGDAGALFFALCLAATVIATGAVTTRVAPTVKPGRGAVVMFGAYIIPFWAIQALWPGPGEVSSWQADQLALVSAFAAVLAVLWFLGAMAGWLLVVLRRTP